MSNVVSIAQRAKQADMPWDKNNQSFTSPDPIASSENALDDLWETAAASLGDDLKMVIGPNHCNQREVLQSVLFEATQKQKQCLEKRWKMKNRKGDVIILRDVFEKIITWVDSFKGIGNSIANMGPGWAAIPWALVSMLLKVVITDNETFATMIEGLEKATRFISRYSVFEAVYLKKETAGTRQLRDSLVALYASVLTFLGESYYYFAKNTARRFIKAFFSDSGVDELLDDMDAKQTEVDRDAQLVSTEVLQAVAEDIRSISNHSTSVTSQLTLMNAHLEHIQDTQLVADDLRGLKDAITAAARPVQRVIAISPLTTDDLSDFQRKAIVDWLSPVPYRLQHMSERHRRLSNSGAWMFETPEYLGWKESSVSETLWLHGMPGCGKTKLLSAVVDYELGEMEKRPGPAPIAYFYCSRNTAEPERSDPAEVLRCIARQLCGDDVSMPLPEQLCHLYKRLGSPAPGTAKLPPSHAVELILDLVRENPATIIIDALDECDPGSRHELFEALDEIVAKSENVTKIFLTSRNDGDIVCRLASTPNIYISAQKNSLDIQRFIDSELDRVIERKQLLCGRISDRLRREIADTLNRRADGMFRWVTLQIQNLCDPRRMRVEGDIRAELGKLPRSLADLYSIAFDQVLASGPESSKLATRALQILLFAFRPFAWAEFLYLISLSRDGIRAGITKDEVLHCANNFIEEDPEVDRVAFPHLSVREYLETRKEFRQPALHIVASQLCMYGIRYPEPLPLSDDPFPRFQFTYAILYIGDHLSKLTIDERNEVEFLEDFLLNDSKLFASYTIRLRTIANHTRYDHDIQQIPNLVIFHSLHPSSMICLYGLEEFAAQAIDQDPEALYRPSDLLYIKHFRAPLTAAWQLDGKSCLEMAVMSRHVGILLRLHASGHPIDKPNEQGETILHLACSNGLDDVTYALLKLGMDPNQRTGPSRQRSDDSFRDRPLSPLGFHVRDAHESGLISPFGTEKELQYPIHLAIAPGKSFACVKALVEHGADSNSRTSRGATALQLSFEMGDETVDIVKLLLSQGADPNAEVGFGRIMLHLAAAMGLAKIVPILVAAGGDVTRRDSFGQTPWDIAVRYGHTDIAAVLAANAYSGLSIKPVTIEQGGDGGLYSIDLYSADGVHFSDESTQCIHSELEGSSSGSNWAKTPMTRKDESVLSSKQDTTAPSYIAELPAIKVYAASDEKEQFGRLDRVKREWGKLKMKLRRTGE